MLSYLSRVGAKINLLVNKKSIFKAYEDSLNLFTNNNKVLDHDVFIFCHDDIEILSSIEDFKFNLDFLGYNDKSGFGGVAGTTYLSESGVWWDQQVWSQGLHKGFVLHGEKITPKPTFYGNYGQVVALDGLFLACRYGTLKHLKLDKPDNFPGLWDFYDIEYTINTHLLGYRNQVLPIFLRHESFGSLAGRESWYKNRDAFIASHTLPIKI